MHPASMGCCKIVMCEFCAPKLVEALMFERPRRVHQVPGTFLCGLKLSYHSWECIKQLTIPPHSKLFNIDHASNFKLICPILVVSAVKSGSVCVRERRERKREFERGKKRDVEREIERTYVYERGEGAREGGREGWKTTREVGDRKGVYV
eukprot:5058193-Pleurochrysis_carterae.AAC.1